LKIALDYGADAVYGGVSHFSLRIRSGKEFTMESFAEGIAYAHERNKKVYVTINGFPFSSQLKLLKNHIEAMADLQPDAFIVATPGVLNLAKKIAPDMPMHLSTQANVMNVLDAQVYYDMGASRIITAREISLKDLKAIKDEIPQLEVEAFVHGSMCFAFSGRCLISAVQSGRVPNRGSCANDCRFPYTLYAENEDTGTLFKLEEQPEVGTYIMNAKDLNLASHIKEIMDSGVVDSIKIEGRTKSPYYTAITARTYSMALRDYKKGEQYPETYQKELASTQNRGFTDAYLIHRPFERNDTQNQDAAMLMGTHQVTAIVNEEGTHFLCRFTTKPNDKMEIIAPLDADIPLVDNEIGTIARDSDGYVIIFKKLLSDAGKEYEAIHSGNTTPIQLPAKLPQFTFFRIKVPESEAGEAIKT